MSAQQLADRTRELGLHVIRSVIANLENGRRDNISVAELVILARALDVPPVLLLYPVGCEDTVEVSPGEQLPPWDALQWFTGASDQDSVIQLFGMYYALARDWSRTWSYLDRPLDDAQAANMRGELQRQEDALLNVRETIEARGYKPPPLPRLMTAGDGDT